MRELHVMSFVIICES